jgi:hypothetical protein
MPARKTAPVRYLYDYDAEPLRQYEAATWSDHALAIFMGGHWSDPSHREPSMIDGTWGVIERGAAPDARPVWMTYERAERLPWAVLDPDHGAAPVRFAQMWEAMEAAVEGVTP